MSDVIVGLDIGTSTIRAVVAEKLETGVLQIIGVGTGISQGLRKGAVVNIEKTVQGIHEAVEAAEMMSGVEITHCITGIGGTHIEGLNSRGIVAVTDKGKGNRFCRLNNAVNILLIYFTVSFALIGNSDNPA